MKLAWLTDIHLDFLSVHERRKFLGRLSQLDADALVITGDLADGDVLPDVLPEIDALGLPVYFVLGNHDYYGRTMARLRRNVRDVVAQSQNLTWLNDAHPITLSPGVALIGHDGWADGRAGNYHLSRVQLNDFVAIEDFRGANSWERLGIMQDLAALAATHVSALAPVAAGTHAHVVIATHVPPWREAAWHEGRTSDDEWAPFFVSQVLGETIEQIATAFPDTQFTVLCGHTHGRGETWPRRNVRVLTGAAIYGAPAVERVLTL